jgi:myo-inositol-1(or 4)-monophosphatase
MTYTDNQAKLEKAITFAIEKHAGQARKGSSIPFITHPLEALSIAAEITSDPEILAATVLHDVVEDTPVEIEEIRELFGERVAILVAAESEDKMPDISPSESWKARKEANLAVLKSAPYEAKIIVLADKLSNMRSMYRDIQNVGESVWERFNQKDKRQHEWYHRSIVEIISVLSDSAAYREYCWLVQKVFAEDKGVIYPIESENEP